jgi:hypothetical protein
MLRASEGVATLALVFLNEGEFAHVSLSSPRLPPQYGRKVSREETAVLLGGLLSGS